MTSRMRRGRRETTAAALPVTLLGAAGLAAAVVTQRAEQPARKLTSKVLRVTGAGKLVSFYRHLAFDLPRLTTTVGVGLLLGIATIRLYWLASYPQPDYLGAYFALVGAMVVLACAGMLAFRWPMVVKAGWVLGSVIATATLLMYIAGRSMGLPDLPGLAGRWQYDLGTFAMALSGGYLAVHFAVLTRMTVAYPQRQHWHD